MGKDFKTIAAELSQPFEPEDLEWRVQTTMKDNTKGLAVAYVTNRAIQDRLDAVVGPENWRNEFRPWHGDGKKDAQICGISIYHEGRGEWITKFDGAEDSDIEPVKGGLSDSMKRAAVQWGIGRLLYKLDPVWVDVEQKGKSYAIPGRERYKLDSAYVSLVAKLNKQGTKKPLDPQLPQTTSQKPPQTRGRELHSPQAVLEYTVIAVKRQRGMNGDCLLVTLQSPDGKTIAAYCNSLDPALRPGTALYRVKLTQKQQNTVVFFILEGYEIISAMPNAA